MSDGLRAFLDLLAMSVVVVCVILLAFGFIYWAFCQETPPPLWYDDDASW